MEIGKCSIVVVDEFHPFGKEEKEGDMRSGDSEEEFRLTVATKESTGYKVESMETYLEGLVGKKLEEELPGALEFWKRNSGNVGFCDEEEVRELLPVMEKNIKLVTEDWERYRCSGS
ncbi:MAG: hypothetical protein Q9188_005393 [Gyalolechia gomerana]